MTLCFLCGLLQIRTVGSYAFTWHTRWNLSQILEIYLTCPSVKEPIEVLGEWRQNLERNALKLTRFVTLQHQPHITTWR